MTFLRSQQQARLYDESVTAAKKAVKIVVLQYQQGAVDFNRYATIEQALVAQQLLAAQARGQIAQGLIAMYRALGGGWEIRLGGDGTGLRSPMRYPACRTRRSKSPHRRRPSPTPMPPRWRHHRPRSSSSRAKP